MTHDKSDEDNTNWQCPECGTRVTFPVKDGGKDLAKCCMMRSMSEIAQRVVLKPEDVIGEDDNG